MRLYKETTVWDTLNHTYLLDENKRYMHGYIKFGCSEIEMFKNPIAFSARGRSFQEMDNDINAPATDKVIISVKGSKGKYYSVELSDDAIFCPCEGFKYRSDCKHIEKARVELYL